MTSSDQSSDRPSPFATTGPPDILMVCTGNVCRSPMAEYMLRGLFEWESNNRVLSRPPRTVGSAGTMAAPGVPIHPLAREALARRNLAVDASLSRQVTDELIASAGLVLTATRQQRAWVAEQSPSDVKHVFAMRDFARLVSAGRRVLPSAAGNATPTLLMLASAGRALLQPVGEESDNIPDPIRGGVAEFEACAELIGDCLIEIFDPVGGA